MKYKPMCPKCQEKLHSIIITGKKPENYCYECIKCEDQIAKEAVIWTKEQ